MSNSVQSNSAVLVHFTLKLDDGSTAESTRGNGKPALFRLGDASLSEGLEQHLLGLKAGDKTTFSLEPDAAFGVPSPDLIQYFSRREFIDAGEPEIGAIMLFTAMDGSEMPGVANQNRLFAAAAGAGDFHMDFSYQRAGSVENRQVTTLRFVAYCLRNPVGGENQDRAVRHFANLFDKNRPTLAQAIDDVAIMDNLVTNVDRRAVQRQRVFDNADSAVNAGAKTARVSQQDLHLTPPAPDRLPALQYQNERYARPADG